MFDFVRVKGSKDGEIKIWCRTRDISRLRAKLEPHGITLRSIRGFGYRLELADGNAPQLSPAQF